MRAAIRYGVIGLVLLTVVGVVAATLVAGLPGLWGALIGAALGGGFILTTALSVRITEKSPPTMAGAVLLGGWVVKMLLAIVVLGLLKGMDFYSKPALGLVVVGALVLVLGAEVYGVLRTTQWRLAEIDSGADRVLAALALPPTAVPLEFDAVATPPIGWLPHGDRVSLGAGIRLGVLDARTAEFLAAIDRPIVVTPWRSVVIPDLDEWAAEQVVRVLAPMGLIFDENSPWLEVSACTGSPGCAKAKADVRGDLSEAVAAGELPVAGRQHWVGCDRGCGRPGGDVADVVATDSGYRVDTD